MWHNVGGLNGWLFECRLVGAGLCGKVADGSWYLCWSNVLVSVCVCVCLCMTRHAYLRTSAASIFTVYAIVCCYCCLFSFFVVILVVLSTVTIVYVQSVTPIIDDKAEITQANGGYCFLDGLSFLGSTQVWRGVQCYDVEF